MRSIPSNILVVITMVMAVVIFSAYASYLNHQWHWFARSGSIMTIGSAFLSIRPIVRLGFREWRESTLIHDGGDLDLSSTPEHQEAIRQAWRDSLCIPLGSALAIVGTLIWAYGDLIDRLYLCDWH